MRAADLESLARLLPEKIIVLHAVKLPLQIFFKGNHNYFTSVIIIYCHKKNLKNVDTFSARCMVVRYPQYLD